MDLQPLVDICRTLPHVIEDVKWGNDLVFSIDGGRMFCVFGFENERWAGVSFKVDEHRFLELTDRPQFQPAPYMARARWIRLASLDGIGLDELEALIRRSHALYFAKLPKKRRNDLLAAGPGTT